MRRAAGRVLVAIAAGAAVAGCATANSVSYSNINPPPRALARRDPGSVDVLVGRSPARPFVEVGLFQVDQGIGQSTEDMLATLRVHAGLRGCDAVQVLDFELANRQRTNWEIVRGVCDVYIDAQAAQAASRPPVTTPLPGEGKPCAPANPLTAPNLPDCPDPLVCTNKVCVSPYH